MNDEKKPFEESNNAKVLATTSRVAILDMMISGIELRESDQEFDESTYGLVDRDYTLTEYVSELYSIAKREDESLSMKARIGVMRNGDFFRSIIRPIDYPVTDIGDYESRVKRNIEYLQNIIDDEGRYFGILAISHMHMFPGMISLDNAVVSQNRDLAEKEFLKLSNYQQERIRETIKNYNDYYECLGFYPIYSDGFIGYSNYVYGDFGRTLSEISKRLVRKGEKLF